MVVLSVGAGASGWSGVVLGWGMDIGFLEWFFLGMPIELFLLFLAIGAAVLFFGGLRAVFDRLRGRTRRP